VSIETDLDIIAEQERLLQFPSFSSATAWELGLRLRDAALQVEPPMTVEIQLAGRTLFACCTGDAPAGQADWIRRKRNTVLRFGRSSYAMGLMLERDGKTIEARHGLTLADYAMHGGGFPIALRDTGLVGCAIVSGLPQRDDHTMVAAAIADILKIQAPQLENERG
jgi:uncharacterized protein (UPF0303 family)